jgi:hypothetical protein
MRKLFEGNPATTARRLSGSAGGRVRVCVPRRAGRGPQRIQHPDDFLRKSKQCRKDHRPREHLLPCRGGWSGTPPGPADLFRKSAGPDPGQLSFEAAVAARSTRLPEVAALIS